MEANEEVCYHDDLLDLSNRKGPSQLEEFTSAPVLCLCQVQHLPEEPVRPESEQVDRASGKQCRAGVGVLGCMLRMACSGPQAMEKAGNGEVVVDHTRVQGNVRGMLRPKAVPLQDQSKTRLNPLVGGFLF